MIGRERRDLTEGAEEMDYVEEGVREENHCTYERMGQRNGMKAPGVNGRLE